MTDLIQKIEGLSEPDREMDVAIAFAFGKVRERDGNYLYATDNDEDMVVEQSPSDTILDAPPLPYYTASLDAALRLFGHHVPRGLTLSRSSNPDMGGRDWIVSSVGKRVAARSWPIAICLLALQTLPHAKEAK